MSFINKRFDVFELGNSAALYYLLIFGILPLSFILTLSVPLMADLAKRGFVFLDYRMFFYLSVGFFALVVGNGLLRTKRIAARIPALVRGDWIPGRVAYVFLAVFLLGFASKVVRLTGGAYFYTGHNEALVRHPLFAVVGYLDWLAYIAIAIAFARYFFLRNVQNPLWRRWQTIAWLALFLECFYGFFTATKALVIYPIVVYLIVRHYVHRRNYPYTALCLLFVVFILMPVMNAYRTNSGLFAPARISSPQVTRAAGEYALDHAVRRFGQSRILEQLFKNDNPPLYGQTLLNFFVILGPPKFLWHDKPAAINSTGNEFGRRYGILDPNDRTTTVGPTMVGEWYLNFGVWGIALGMFFVGILFHFIFASLAPGSSLSGAVFYGTAWVFIIHGMESWIAPVYAGLIKMFVIFFVIHLFLTARHGWFRLARRDAPETP